MKKIFTLSFFVAISVALLAQNPYVNADMTGLANSFDTEDDVQNEYMYAGWRFAQIAGDGDTALITWVDEAMKVEAKYNWDYALANFLISPDGMETIDISENIHCTFKYKNLTQDVALVANFLINEGGELVFGGDIWLEGGDVTYGSNEWVTVDQDFTIENPLVNQTAVLQIGIDGIENASVVIDDVVFGNYTMSTNDIYADPFAVKVYPNPASDYIEIGNVVHAFDVNIFNIVGQKILQAQDQKRIDISSLEKGLYFVEVSTENKTQTRKILVN